MRHDECMNALTMSLLILFTGRVLVHEWGHYWWGLFNEYADPVGDPDNYQHFYLNYINGLWEGVR